MPISVREPLLSVAGLVAGYGNITVLHGVDLFVRPGEIVALLGPNGAGKTTLLRAVSGLLPWTGQAHFDGQTLSGVSPRETARRGLVHVVEGHRRLEQARVRGLVVANSSFAMSMRHTTARSWSVAPPCASSSARASALTCRWRSATRCGSSAPAAQLLRLTASLRSPGAPPAAGATPTAFGSTAMSWRPCR